MKSNRVGARLSGPVLSRAIAGELPSEGVVLGAVQVPADGQPLVFLADHPTTGGYPIIGVVDRADLPAARPGPARHDREVRGMDLNADLGEGFGVWRLGDDDALLRLVTSANVACGFHAGDAVTMRRVCEWAADRGVAVGAQVGYRDLAGFGRRRIEYDLAELRDDIIYQIAALNGFCRLQGEQVRYVKPHGALYNTATVDVWQASAIVAAIVDYDRTLPLLCLPGSTLADARPTRACGSVPEGYADRAYRPDGTLVPRRDPGAVISDVDTVVARAVRMATAAEVAAQDGTVVAAPVQSLCLHGDTPGAVDLTQRVREALESAGVRLASFVPLD